MISFYNISTRVSVLWPSLMYPVIIKPSPGSKWFVHNRSWFVPPHFVYEREFERNTSLKLYICDNKTLITNCFNQIPPCLVGSNRNRLLTHRDLLLGFFGAGVGSGESC